MNILIKLMSIVSLVIAPYLSLNGILHIGGNDAKAACCKEMKAEACADKMEKCEAGKNCTYLLDTTYTDAEGHTIVERKCIVTKGDEKACCKDKEASKKECCEKKVEIEKEIKK